ncbi:hypothetical protein NLJ89_g3880 [Agrocybe chaxingu]|uniref:Uncharacterized protein n=1 Tax=Agrocybe chaxingu TaxID=84603 RepID=A0A9W8MV31_9AGAR|nr:hypothetical protein NLJ89_g3880 [Agrocybe chaxingu]
MYNHSLDGVLKSLFPLPAGFVQGLSHHTVQSTLASGSSLHQLSSYLCSSAGSSLQVLTTHAAHVKELWQDMVALGLHDQELWDTVDLAWGDHPRRAQPRRCWPLKRVPVPLSRVCFALQTPLTCYTTHPPYEKPTSTNHRSRRAFGRGGSRTVSISGTWLDIPSSSLTALYRILTYPTTYCRTILSH